MATEKESYSTILPAIRYRDLDKAADFLKKAFGFKKNKVHEKDAEGPVRLTMTYGRGMVHLGRFRKTDFSKHTKHPDEVKGRVTQSQYVQVANIDAHYKKAKGAGADIIIDIKDGGSGRSYSARDSEGHVWTFGTRDYWQG